MKRTTVAASFAASTIVTFILMVIITITFFFERNSPGRAGLLHDSLAMQNPPVVSSAEDTAQAQSAAEEESTAVEQSAAQTEEAIAETIETVRQAAEDVFQEQGDLLFDEDEAIALAETSPGFFPDEIIPQIPENIVLEADGNLLRHEADGDVFARLSLEKSRLNTVLGNDTLFVSNKYDTNLRILTRTVWQKEQEAADAAAITQAVYFYDNNEAKNARMREVTSFLQNTREKTEYDFDGLPLRVTFTQEDGKKQNIVLETFYAYDSQRRVSEKNSRDFSDTDSAHTERIRYEYTQKAVEPDTFIFRDGVLIKSIEHEADGDYTETRMLGENYSVRALYKNSTLIREIFLFNGKEIRRREY